MRWAVLRQGRGTRFPVLHGGAGLGLALLLGACTLVPDWADPTGGFPRDATFERVGLGAAGAAADAPTSFPNLASVPDRRPKVMTSAARSELRRDLEIDRAQGAAGAEPTPRLAPESAAVDRAERPRRHPERGELAGHIYFPYGSATIGDKDRKLLRRILARYRLRGGSIRVVGHASGQFGVSDPMRRNLDSFEVSLRRANLVASEIMALGVPRDRILIEAVGDREPLEPESARNGAAGNRRAEIFLEK